MSGAAFDRLCQIILCGNNKIVGFSYNAPPERKTIPFWLREKEQDLPSREVFVEELDSTLLPDLTGPWKQLGNE